MDPLYSLIPTGITGHTTSFFDAYPQQNAGRARALLEKAAELKTQLESGGLFKVTLKGYEWTDFQKRWAAGKLDAYGVGWVADFPDPDTYGGPLVGTEGTMNTGYSDSAVDRLIQKSQRWWAVFE